MNLLVSPKAILGKMTNMLTLRITKKYLFQGIHKRTESTWTLSSLSRAIQYFSLRRVCAGSSAWIRADPAISGTAEQFSVDVFSDKECDWRWWRELFLAKKGFVENRLPVRKKKHELTQYLISTFLCTSVFPTTCQFQEYIYGEISSVCYTNYIC